MSTVWPTCPSTVDPLGGFPLFLKMVADIIAPKLSTIFVG